MDDTCQVRGSAALSVRVSSWLRDEDAAKHARASHVRLGVAGLAHLA